MTIKAGKAHTNIVRNAKSGPPTLYPMDMIVWVLLGPGKMEVKAMNSTSSSSVRYFLFTTI